MNFEQWMIAEGLSESSVKANSDAINGPLSVWADLQDFSFGSLSSVIDLDVFNALAKKIEAADDFQIRNRRGHDIYGTALNKYREFLISLNSSKLAHGFGPHARAMAGLEVGLGLESTIPRRQRDEREQVLIDIIRRRGQNELRSKLLTAYGSRCAITGCGVIELLEVAHITPYMAAAADPVKNALLLRADIHTLWDLGLIALDPATLTVWVHPQVADPGYLNLVDSNPFLPLADHQKPSIDALKLQWQTVHPGHPKP